MAAPVLIFAIGNESRGDDAIAPLLLRRLGAWMEAEDIAGQFELLEDFQLQVEHATDMVGRKLVLFIDAGMDTPAPYFFCRARPHGQPPKPVKEKKAKSQETVKLSVFLVANGLVSMHPQLGSFPDGGSFPEQPLRR